MVLDKGKGWKGLHGLRRKSAAPTGILWPSLGFPALFEDTRNPLVLTVLLVDPTPASREFPKAAGWLRPVVSPQIDAFALHCESIERVRLSDVLGIGRWSDWVLEHCPLVLRVAFECPAPSLPRQMNLFDLHVEYAGHRFTKVSAVAIRKASPECNVMLATDIHIATRWETFEDGFRECFGDAPDRSSDDLLSVTLPEVLSRRTVLNSFVNPNRNLAWLIRTANSLAATGSLDALILSGDLVDFKYPQEWSAKPAGDESSEWEVFRRILLGEANLGTRLEVPLFTTTGNHDYRLYPYRLRTYGIRHAGVPDDISRRYCEPLGEWRAPKYALRDLDAISVDTGRTAHSLDRYFADINPCTDYELSVGGLRLLALDTGPDAMTNLGRLLAPRRWRFIKGALRISRPASDGFDDRQIPFIRSWFEKAKGSAAILISHAPVIAPPLSRLSSLRRKRELLTVVPEQSGAARFEDTLAESGLDIGCVSRNQLPLLAAMRQHDGSTFLFSGHAHVASAMSLDKSTGELFLEPGGSVDVSTDSFERHALVLTTPALAHYMSKDATIGNPSFRMLRTSAGKLVGADLKPVLEQPLDDWVYEWSLSRVSPSTERIAFRFSPRVPRPEFIARRLVLYFGHRPIPRMTVTMGESVDIAQSRVSFDQSPAYACLVSTALAGLELDLQDRPSGAEVWFLYETLRSDRRTGLRWHFRSYR